MSVTHTHVSTQTQSADPAKVSKNEWNDEHVVDVAHSDLTGVGVNDHHAKAHASTHSNGGNDEVTVENLGTAASNTALVLKPDGSGGVAFGAQSGGNHDLLDGSVAQDSLAGSVVDGDVIIGNATPKWSRLARSVPGGAALLNVLGMANGDTRPSWKALFDATAPVTQTFGDAAAAGTAVVAAHRDHTHGMPATPAAAAHNLFSTSHGDTTGAASPVDGDIIIGNVTPAWSKLAISIPGGAGLLNVLGVVNGELRASWKALFDATAPTTQAFGDAAAAGTAVTAAHRDHKHAWPAQLGYVMTLPFFGNVSASTTVVVNSTTYMVPANWAMNIVNAVGYTHFCIYVDGNSNEAGQTIKIQPVPSWTVPATALSAAGDDITLTNTRTGGSTGWIAIGTPGGSLAAFAIALKGSNGSVDLTVFTLTISLAVIH